MRKLVMLLFVGSIAGLVLYYAKPELFKKPADKQAEPAVTLEKEIKPSETVPEKEQIKTQKTAAVAKKEEPARESKPIPTVMPCPDCKRTGIIKCRTCKGSGELGVIRCPSCDKQLVGVKEGKIKIYTCTKCKYKQTEANPTCETCNGEKTETCPKCKGSGLVTGFAEDLR